MSYNALTDGWLTAWMMVQSFGVIEEGGILQTLEATISITALPNAIPSSIKLDVTEMNVGDTLTVADLPEMEGVTYVNDDDHAVATVSLPAAEIVEEPVLEEGEEGEGVEGEEGEGVEGEEGAGEDEG